MCNKMIRGNRVIYKVVNGENIFLIVVYGVRRLLEHCWLLDRV